MISFGEWYELPHRSEWKLGWWEATGIDLSQGAKEILKEYPGVAEPTFVGNARQGDFVKGEWMLYFYLRDKSPTHIEWRFVDLVVPVSSSDEGAYNPYFPCQVVQIWPLTRYPSPPFLIDRHFGDAFKKVVRDFGAERIKVLKSLKLPAHFVDLIHGCYADLE